MSNIVPYQDIEKMASAVAASKLFGVKNPNEAIALMLVAQAEGLHPATAARDYHVIQGRPALKADAMLARFQQAGGSVQWKEYTDDKVTGVFSHPQGGTLELSWTLAQAKAIGIANKENWRNYPRAMLRARVISEGIRSVYPGCVVGVYTPEEVQDFEPAPTRMAEPVVIQEYKPDGKFKLLVPNNPEPYATFEDQEEFAVAYGQLVAKVWNSPKLSGDAKHEKMKALAELNSELLDSISSIAIVKMKAELASAGVPIFPKESQPLSADQEPNEAPF